MRDVVDDVMGDVWMMLIGSVGELLLVDGVLPDVDLAVVEGEEVGIGEAFDSIELCEFLGEFGVGEGESAEEVVLVVEDVLEVGDAVAGVSRGEHDEAGLVLLAALEGDADGGGDALGVLLVVGLAAVAERALGHQLTGLTVEERLVPVVLGLQHQRLPDLVEVGEGGEAAVEGLVLEGLAEDGGDDVDHGVVGGLAGGGCLLGGVSDDSEGGFVGDDVDVLDVLDLVVLGELGVVDDALQALQGARRLVLVQPQLEVHAHHGEVRPAVGQGDVEGGVPVGLLEEPEDAFGVAEDVLGPDEAASGALDAHDGGLGGDGGGGALGVAELFAGPDGAPGDVVGHKHADGVLDLERGGAHQRPVGADRGDGPVHHVVDLVRLQRKHLAQPPSDLVLQRHRLKGSRTVDPRVHVGGSHHHWVEVVVSKLAGLTLRVVCVSEHGAVGVPLADGRTVGHDGLLDGDEVGATKDASVFEFGVLGEGGFERLVAEDVGRVGLEGEGGEAADDGVGVEHLGAFEHLRGGVALLDEVDSVFGKLSSLVGVLAQDHRREAAPNQPQHHLDIYLLKQQKGSINAPIRLQLMPNGCNYCQWATVNDWQKATDKEGGVSSSPGCARGP